MVNKRELGSDAKLFVNGSVFAITGFSYSETTNTETISFNDGLNPERAITSVTYSGSFEHVGEEERLRDAVSERIPGDGGPTQISRNDISIKVETDAQHYYFRDCTVEARDKDFPADDRTEVSYSFVSKRLEVRDVR